MGNERLYRSARCRLFYGMKMTFESLAVSETFGQLIPISGLAESTTGGVQSVQDVRGPFLSD